MLDTLTSTSSAGKPVDDHPAAPNSNIPCEAVSARPISLSLGQSEVAAAWTQYASALAAWANKNLVNRRDIHGRYIAKEKRSGSEGTAITEMSPATLVVLQKHFEGASTGDLIGLHSTVSDDPEPGQEFAPCWCRWLAIDIDRHDDSVDGFKTFRIATALYDQLVKLGFSPLLFNSNGNGGYHLMVLFDGPVESGKVYAFAKWLRRGWREWGLEDPETFPKQPRIAPKGSKHGSCGNWLRLPGRHHTRDHYTEVWNGTTWLEGAAAIKAILGTKGNNSDLIPAEALKIETPKKSKSSTTPNLENDAAEAARALDYLDPSMPYPEWLEIGMSLTQLGRQGLDIWDSWSSSSEKYREGVCDKKWATFTRSTGGVALGTLFAKSKAFGFEFRKQAGRNGAAVRTSATATPKILEAPVTAEGDSLPPDAPAIDTDTRPQFSNYHHENEKDAEGRKKARVVAHNVHEITADLDRLMPGWPKRVGGKLFLQTGDFKPVYLNTAPRLFAAVDAIADVNWTKGATLIPQERFAAHLEMTVEAYDAIEILPHTPRMPNIFYMHQELPRSRGYLKQLVGFFSPDSEADRSLIEALIITPSWGGGAGQRPAWLITGPDVDPDGRKGRGVGKSKATDIISQELYEGFLDVSPRDDMAKVKTRLLSKEGIHKRILRIDNVKTLRFSWDELEGLITSPTISGHALYEGEGQRPNTLSVVITLNGPSLSKDLAERVNVIKLARPPEDRPESEEDWETRVRRFARSHRWEILSEIRDFLELPPGPLKPMTRWGAWERAVLSKLPHAEECQRVLKERQGAIDDDDEKSEEFREFIIEQLIKRGYDPNQSRLKIPSRIMGDWVVESTRKAHTQATHYVKELNIKELIYDRKSDFRGFLWTGQLSSGGYLLFDELLPVSDYSRRRF